MAFTSIPESNGASTPPVFGCWLLVLFYKQPTTHYKQQTLLSLQWCRGIGWRLFREYLHRARVRAIAAH
jgi:hypothetical protein